MILFHDGEYESVDGVVVDKEDVGVGLIIDGGEGLDGVGFGDEFVECELKYHLICGVIVID